MRMQQSGLYLLVLVLMFAVVISALGGGLFNQQSPWISQWQHQAFFDFCHQIPERSFWINGQPMAVCSRCIGIYSGFTVGWLLLPLWSVEKSASGWSMKKIALAFVLINFFDIVGNMLGFWQNTLVSRLAMGYTMGISAALIFTGDSFKVKIKSKGNNYGRVTESTAAK